MDFGHVKSERLENLDTNDLLIVVCGEPLCLVPCKFGMDFQRLCLGLSVLVISVPLSDRIL